MEQTGSFFYRAILVTERNKLLAYLWTGCVLHRFPWGFGVVIVPTTARFLVLIDTPCDLQALYSQRRQICLLSDLQRIVTETVRRAQALLTVVATLAGRADASRGVSDASRRAWHTSRAKAGAFAYGRARRWKQRPSKGRLARELRKTG